MKKLLRLTSLVFFSVFLVAKPSLSEYPSLYYEWIILDTGSFEKCLQVLESAMNNQNLRSVLREGDSIFGHTSNSQVGAFCIQRNASQTIAIVTVAGGVQSEVERLTEKLGQDLELQNRRMISN